VRIQARVWCDLKAELNGSRVVGFGAGPDQRVYVLVCLGEADESWIDRRSPCDWRVLAVGAREWREYQVPNQLSNFSLVQPMPDGLLLATSRCEYSESSCKPNGQIFSLDGVRHSVVMLGDGIQHLQTTQSGEIWAAYFDEGVFGNLGWRRPIGANGLLRFNTLGDRLFEFQPTSGLETIADCYALNVVGNSETWCYYYTEFPLVRIVNDRIDQYWQCPIKGAGAFAVWRDSVLMQGGYDLHQEWNLMTLHRDGKVRLEGTGRIEDDLGDLTYSGARFVTARGRHVWYLRDGIIFNVDVKDLVT
jgi:hypothetical protein